jgi:chromosome segregation ATPase
MSDIAELEGRIAAALDRIAWQVESQPAASGAAPAQAAPDGDLVEELEVERATNARLVASREKHVARIERLETRVLRLTDRLQSAEVENKRLEAVIAQLGENNDALRAANAAHQGAADAADAGAAAQLADLKSLRAKDLEDMDEIMAELAPLVKEA